MTGSDDYAIKPEISASEQQAKAEALFYSIGEGAISTDEFGRITRANPIARKILGYNKAELIGQWFPKKIVALNADDRSINLIDRPITKAFLTGRPVSAKTFYRRKNGQKIPVAITVSPILVEGKPLGAIEVFRDISFEEEVDRMKSEFISLASHQLRTPLSAIKTYSHMLIEGYMGDVTDEQRQSLSTIVSAANRMNELISNLLNITRMEGGTVAVSKTSLSVEALVKEILKELALPAENKAIQLSMKVGGDGAAAIRTDRSILKEVLTNLISNSIKYTPDEGKVKVSIRLKDEEIIIKVSDNGWGIPKYSQEQIFTKFFRADNITKRETSGTGLGLYLVRGMVETIDGRVSFKSREGKGTDFYITLPRRAKRQRTTRKPGKDKLVKNDTPD